MGRKRPVRKHNGGLLYLFRCYIYQETREQAGERDLIQCELVVSMTKGQVMEGQAKNTCAKRSAHCVCLFDLTQCSETALYSFESDGN